MTANDARRSPRVQAAWLEHAAAIRPSQQPAGDGAQQLDDPGVWGERQLDPFGEVLDRGVELVDVREQLRDHDPVMLELEALWSASRSCGIFARILAVASSTSRSGSVTPESSASSIARADFE